MKTCVLCALFLLISATHAGVVKKTLKSTKHALKTPAIAANATALLKEKNGKRWMRPYPAPYMQQEPVQGSPFTYGEQPFGGPPDSLGYGFNGFKDNPYEDNLKLNTKPRQNSYADDLSPNFATDVATYLKPGIGDYPSDMPMMNNGKQSYDPMANIGMPIQQEKAKPSVKFSPALSALAQMAMDDAALNPTLTPHKQPSPVASDVDTNPLNSEPAPEPTPSFVNTVIESKSDDAAGLEKPKVETDAVTANGPIEAKEDQKPAKVEKPPTIEAKAESSPPPEKPAEKPATTEKAEKNAAKEEETKKEVEEKKVKAKETSKSNKEKPTTVEKTKTKTQTGARRQQWDTSGISDIPAGGFQALSNPDPYNNEIESAEATEAETESGEKTPTKVKAKLVTSLRQALLDNMKEMMNNKAQEDTDDLIKAEKEDSRLLTEEMNSSEKEAQKEEDLDSADESKTAVLEQNLMKIEKPKLVHLLATLMRKNEQREEVEGGVEDVTEAKLKPSKIKTNKMVAKFIDDSAKEGESESESTPATTKAKHKGKHSEHDPYANIGNADPNNADVSATKAKHVVHKQQSNEEMISKAKQDSQSQEDRNDERNSAEERVQERQSKEENEALHAKAEDGEEAKQGHKSESENKNESESKEDESAEQVAAEVEAEKVELKKLKALERAEKERELELKASNAALASKNAKANEAASVAAAVEDTDTNTEAAAKEEEDEEPAKKPAKAVPTLAQSTKIHLVSPELVQAIADHLQKNKEDSEEEDEDTSKEDVKEALKQAEKNRGKEQAKENENSEDEKESAKESDALADEGEKASEKEGESSLNVQTLIEHMKQSLVAAGKTSKNKAKQEKSGKRGHGKNAGANEGVDDAYSQIGSQDLNVKRSRKFKKTAVVAREKKHHVHHTHIRH